MLSLGLGVTSSLTSVDALVRGVYSAGGVLPRVALDFDDNKYVLDSGPTSFNKAFMGTSPRLTYSTSSNSTMVNSSGNIVWAPHNLVEYSEDFTTGWSLRQLLPFGSGSVSNATTGPDDNATADLIVPNTASSNEHYIRTVNQAALATGAVGTFSVFVKAAGYTSLSLRLVGTDAAIINYDLTAVTADDAGGTIEFVGNSWYRCTITGTGTGTNAWPWIYPNQQATYAGDGNSGIYIYGAHLYRSDLGGMAPVPGAATGFETYVPTNGNAEYLPRVGHHVYNGSAWVNEGLLIESEQRTNLVEYSEDFTATEWLASNTAPLAINSIGPDGKTSAVTLSDSGAGGTGQVEVRDAGVPVVELTTYTASFFAKADQLSIATIRLAGGFNLNIVSFDLSSGEVLSGSGSIEDFGNGWYRCSVTATTKAGATSIDFRIILSETAGNLIVNLDGTSSILIYGAQFEAGSTPSSYIPTNGSTVTRDGQSLTVPPAQFGWPEPEFIGPELVDNGGFDTDTDWTKGTGWTINTTTGKAVHSGSAGYLSQNILTEGKVYQITFDIVSLTNPITDFVQPYLNNSPALALFSSVGTHTIIGTALDPVLGFALRGSGDITIDNISVREINPLSVSLQMDGRMTYADTGSVEMVFWRWYINNSNRMSSDLRASGVLTGQPYFFQTASGIFDDADASIDAYTPGILTPFNIASRHGSTFVNGAVDGVALTADTTPTALPDLSNTDLQIAYDFMGTIGQFRQFAGDIGDTGLEEATS